MTKKKYSSAMQRFYEREVMTFLDKLPETMTQHHAELIPADKDLEQVKKRWKRRTGYVWLKFLLSEQELKQTE